MEKSKVTIIGLGLIGGSLARALRERMGIKDITAVNRSLEPINQAIADGNIVRGFTGLNEYVLDSDIIFICTPVKRAMEYIDLLAGKVKPGCIITDVGSTKTEIVSHVNKMDNPPCFIGGHPMAGTEKTGYAASFPHLFENAYYILTPAKSTAEYAMDCMLKLVKAIGGIPVILDADEHDKITGAISHVPHVIASALVNMVREMDSPEGKMRLLAAGGFKDITRIASSSPEMWENIISSNRQKVYEILDCYIAALENIKNIIRKEDPDRIFNFFETAREYRNSFSSTRKGLISPNYEITVDVVDKPGIIGEIATILGKNNVNIKNINVSNSREFEQGCLRITLPDPESVGIAYDLLLYNGYKVFRNV